MGWPQHTQRKPRALKARPRTIREDFIRFRYKGEGSLRLNARVSVWMVLQR